MITFSPVLFVTSTRRRFERTSTTGVSTLVSLAPQVIRATCDGRGGVGGSPPVEPRVALPPGSHEVSATATIAATVRTPQMPNRMRPLDDGRRAGVAEQPERRGVKVHA